MMVDLAVPSHTNSLLAPLDAVPRRSDERRLRLVRIAIECLAKEGIASTTLERVARDAKMRRSHAAYYFPHATDLVFAAARYVVSAIEEETKLFLAERRDPSETLAAYVDKAFSWFQQHPDHTSMLALLHYYATIEPRFRALHSVAVEKAQARIESMLRAYHEKPVRSRVAITNAATRIRSLITNALSDHFTTGTANDYAQVRRRTRTAILALADDLAAH